MAIRQLLKVISGEIKRVWHSWVRIDRSNVVVVVVLWVLVNASVL